MIPLHDDTPRHGFPIVTIALIAINILVFAGWQTTIGLQQSVQLAAFVPAALTHGMPGGVSGIFSSMFMHGGWMHLIGNMWFLWIFGDNVEDATGSPRFLIFYLLCGVAATLAHTLSDPQSFMPLVGASGAVSGVLGAYLLKHPKALVRTLIPLGIFTRILDIPAFVFLLIWMGLQVVSQAATYGGSKGGGVAYLAHIGGFIAGIVLINLFQKSRPQRSFR